MRRKRRDNFSWRRRGHRRRFTQDSVNVGYDEQNDHRRRIVIEDVDVEYSEQADTVQHRHHLKNAKPFSRQFSLDPLHPYHVSSKERDAVKLHHDNPELRVYRYLQETFHHRIEEFQCVWLEGNPQTPCSLRMFFTGLKAFFIQVDKYKGIFRPSIMYGSVKQAKMYYSLGSLSWSNMADLQEPREVEPPLENMNPATMPVDSHLPRGRRKSFFKKRKEEEE